MKTWVLVADSSRARLFVREDDQGLKEMEAFVCPEERLREQSLTTDREGRSFDSRGRGRHGMAPATSQLEQTAVGFAAELAERLEALRTSGALERLVLIAAPRFLGHLRAKLSGPVADLTVLTVDKDLTRQDPDRIAEHIPPFPR